MASEKNEKANWRFFMTVEPSQSFKKISVIETFLIEILIRNIIYDQFPVARHVNMSKTSTHPTLVKRQWVRHQERDVVKTKRGTPIKDVDIFLLKSSLKCSKAFSSYNNICSVATWISSQSHRYYDFNLLTVCFLKEDSLLSQKLSRPRCFNKSAQNESLCFGNRLHACLECAFIGCWTEGHISHHFEKQNHFLGTFVLENSFESFKH